MSPFIVKTSAPDQLNERRSKGLCVTFNFVPSFYSFHPSLSIYLSIGPSISAAAGYLASHSGLTSVRLSLSTLLPDHRQFSWLR